MNLGDFRRRMDAHASNLERNYADKTAAELKALFEKKRIEMKRRFEQDNKSITRKWAEIEAIGGKVSPRQYLENYLQISKLETINAALLEQAKLHAELAHIAGILEEKHGQECSINEIAAYKRAKTRAQNGIEGVRGLITEHNALILDAMSRAKDSLEKNLKIMKQRRRKRK